MEILSQLQSDILDQGVSLSAILRKAKVLAAQLNSKELDDWASRELDGYDTYGSLPDYRILTTSASGMWTNGYYRVRNHSVPLFRIEREDLLKTLTQYPVYGGIRTVEHLVEDLGEKVLKLPQEIVAVVNSYVGERGYGYTSLHYTLGPHSFDQILDTVRNRLLEFILKLDKEWTEDKDRPAESQVRDLVNVNIFNRGEGGHVTVFDQRGQSVQYQFNAAGNINLSSVSTIEDLSQQLKYIRDEIQSSKAAKAITEESAVEAEYHVLQADKEIRSANPKKKSILDHIGRAKKILGDFAAAAGLIKAFAEAAEVIGRIL